MMKVTLSTHSGKTITTENPKDARDFLFEMADADTITALTESARFYRLMRMNNWLEAGNIAKDLGIHFTIAALVTMQCPQCGMAMNVRPNQYGCDRPGGCGYLQTLTIARYVFCETTREPEPIRADGRCSYCGSNAHGDAVARPVYTVPVDPADATICEGCE